MSLVNDMLRDLDSRRRDAGNGGLSREKLIPVSDSRRKSAQAPVMLKWLVPILIMVLALGIVLVWRMQQQQQIPVSEQTLPTAAPATAMPVPEPRVDQGILDEMQRMSLRMEQLEQRNIALELQVEQTTPVTDALASPPAEQAGALPLAPETGLPESPADTMLASAPSALVEQPVALAADDAPAPPSDAEPSASTLVRMPAQVNFRELDLKQVQDALSLWQQGQQSAALDSLQRFASANPQAHQSREILAKLMVQQGDMIGALEQADLGLGIQPDHYGYKKVKARVLMAAGVPAEAADLLALRAPSLAGDSEYHELLAASRLASQKYAEALASYEALSASAPLDARWWYGVAAAQDALGSSFEAVQSYERALQLGGLTPMLRESSQQRIASIRAN